MTSTSPAELLAEQLRLRNQRLVLAESCTGGLAAALMTQIPGISDFFCGSAVTYREGTKIEWLGISKGLIEQFTAESQQTTEAMAKQILQKTPEADLAAAITGHLGPGVEPRIDGLVFVSIRFRNQTELPPAITTDGSFDTHCRLVGKDRISRQREGAEWLLQSILQQLTVVPREGNQ